MATPKPAAKVDETKPAPSTGKAVVLEPETAKAVVAASSDPVVAAPKEAPKATLTAGSAVKTEEAPKAATATARAATTEEAPKAVVAAVFAVEAKTPEDVPSTSAEGQETASESPPETEAFEQDLPEAAPVEPSIPEFAEESNVVAELKAHEKKSLEEFKLRVEKAIKENEFRAPKKKLESTPSIKESEPIEPKELVKAVRETPATTDTTQATDAAETSAAKEETKEAVVEKVEEKSKDVSTAVAPAIEEKQTEKAKEVPVVTAAATPASAPKANVTEKPKEAAARAPNPVEVKPPAAEKAKEVVPVIVAARQLTEKAKEVTAAIQSPGSVPVDAPVVEVKVAEKAADAPRESATPVVAVPTTEPVLETVTPVFVEDSEDVEATELAEDAPVVPIEESDDSTPEDISLWGVPLLHTKGDKRTDVILLKFLRARDFNVNQAFKQLKKTIIWRKNFKTDTILDEEFGTDLDEVAFMHGHDREGHPVCYNVFGTLEDKKLYQKNFGDSSKIAAFIRWRVQVLEKGIGLLNFTPEGPSALVQIADMKNSGFFTKKDFKTAASQATDLLQDNYPELVVRKIFVNAPWYFNALYSVVSPFLSQRTRSKLTVAPAGKTTEHMLKFIAAEHIPVQYGGLSRTNDRDFSGVDAPVHELILKAGEKQSIEIPLEKTGTSVVWDLTVVGYDANYEAEFLPTAEGAYVINIEKSKKLPASTEIPIRSHFKATEPGKVVLTVDNSSKKKKIVLYRYLVKAEELALSA